MNSSDKSLYITLLHSGHETSAETKPWGPGVRDCYILHYVISGAGYYETNGKRYHIHAGQSFLITPETLIYYYPDKNDPWEYIWVNFSGLQAEKLLSKCGAFALSPVFETELSPLMYFKYVLESFSADKYKYFTNDARLHLLLAWYAENYPAADDKRLESVIEPILRYIDQNYHKPQLNIDSVSSALNLNRSTLYRIFIKNLGISPTEYIFELRTKKACELLKDDRLTVKAIAFSLGFENQMYFTKFFKRRVGMSPSEYRQK